jgi:type IV secretory pathway VirB4 component
MNHLDIEVENVDEQIEVFRAEEIARAAIAQANYKIFLKKQKERTSPKDEEKLEELAMDLSLTNEEVFLLLLPREEERIKNVSIFLLFHPREEERIKNPLT